MHDKEIYHGDIKAANILIFSEDMKYTKEELSRNVDTVKRESLVRFKLSDFGNGHYKEIADSVSHQSERNKSNIGTYPFTAPELFEEGGKISKATDMFSLGMLFYEILRPDLSFPWNKEFETYGEKTKAEIKKRVLIGERPAVKDVENNPKGQSFFSWLTGWNKPSNDCEEKQTKESKLIKSYEIVMMECWQQDPQKSANNLIASSVLFRQSNTCAPKWQPN